MSRTRHYDIIVVGAGREELFAALELRRHSKARVLLNKGATLDKQDATLGEYGPACCHPCAITCGWGGAGAFSDGKLTLSAE